MMGWEAKWSKRTTKNGSFRILLAMLHRLAEAKRKALRAMAIEHRFSKRKLPSCHHHPVEGVSIRMEHDGHDAPAQKQKI